MKQKNIVAIIVLVVAVCAACKNEFLNVRPSIKQRVPSSLTDYLALMNNTALMNASSHALGMMGADEYYITEESYDSFPTGVLYNYQKRAYTWGPIIFEGNESEMLDWNDGFKRILWANLVLEGLNEIDLSNEDPSVVDKTRGTARFHRAWNYYNLAQLFCEPYRAENTGKQLGLPLRLESDLTVSVGRSSLEATYKQIINDLEAAEKLLPEFSENIYCPNRLAVTALLARVYLQMNNYQKAYEYAEKNLLSKPALLDYNELNMDDKQVFAPKGANNPEIIFMATISGSLITYLRLLSVNLMCPDSSLMSAYGDGDLRRDAFFDQDTKGKPLYRGSYDGSSLYTYFTGLAVDEQYLIRAECAARLGYLDVATKDLNELRKHRFMPEEFIELSDLSQQELIDYAVKERRKEMVLRGTRWEDLRRLNREPRYEKTIIRKLGEATYSLTPQSKRYVWPLPVEAVQVGGYEQNER